jgi:asparagine synthase (glutamine-hydrolysing)
MCGIAGKVVFGRDDQVRRDVVVAMTNALAYRGPDGAGFHFARQVGLGHRRLDVAGHRRERQPLGSYAQTVWVALDGEIQNAAELRAQLQRRGRVFCTTGGAEVLVQGYEQWGDQVVDRLRGVFAFALWDEPRKRLILGRDRLGVQPLCYSVLDGRGLVFASDIRALLEDPDVSRDWDPAAVREYLALGYVPSPGTIFSRLVKLLPGRLLTLEHGRARVRRYWDVPFDAGQGRPEGEYVAALGELVDDVTRMEGPTDRGFSVLMPPRPASAALVASLAATQGSLAVATTVALDRLPMNEVQQARAIAKRFGRGHHAELVTLRLSELLPRLAWYFDEPFGDASAVTTYYLTSAARAQGPVALAAAGSNHLWAGEPHHRIEQMEAQARRWLGPLGPGVGLVGQLAPLPFDLVRSARRLVFRDVEACARHRSAPRSRLRRLCSGDFLRETAGVDPLSSLRSAYLNCASHDGLARALYVDLKTHLVDNALTRIDRMSAASALRMRLPMIDHRMVEFAATVPSSLKVHGKQRHHLFRRLLEGRVPPGLLRDVRQPFQADPAAWLRGPLASMASDVLFSGRFRQRGLFDSKAVTRAWQAHLTGRRDHHRELWSLLMLELWFERVVDGGERRLRAA